MKSIQRSVFSAVPGQGLNFGGKFEPHRNLRLTGLGRPTAGKRGGKIVASFLPVTT